MNNENNAINPTATETADRRINPAMPGALSEEELKDTAGGGVVTNYIFSKVFNLVNSDDKKGN